VTESRLSTFAALKGRNYCLYWFGLVFYVLGHRAEYMTFAWITWEISRDPLTLGYLGLAQGVPPKSWKRTSGTPCARPR